MKRNYKDDFDFIMRLYSAMVDSSGREVGDSRRELGWPDYDWVATFYTSSKANAYVASCIGGECVNCYNDNGQIHIVVNSHHMGPGRLKVEFRAELPRDIYPDGYQRNVIPEPLGIELIVGKGDLPSEMEVELLLPYIKGDAFTYADFTPEQIADLKRPATEAAGRLDSFVQTASEAETTRVANEKLRVNAEATRVSQEESRVSAEKTRVADETKRREAEAERAKAEEARRTAETKRATEFASWETELDGKAEKSELSNIVGIPTEEVIVDDMKPYTLTNRVGESISPMTSTRTVFDEKGVDLDTLLEQQRQDADNALKDYAKKTEVTQGLARKQDKLTPTADIQITDDNIIGLTEAAKMRLFIDLWNEACGIWGKYNPQTDFFELNGLTDITYKEAVTIYEAGPLIDSLNMYSEGVFRTIRTNLPSKRETKTVYKSRAVTLYTDAFPVEIEIVNLNPVNKKADLYIDNVNVSHYTFGAKRYIGVCNLILYNYTFDALQVSSAVEHLLLRCLHTNANMRSVKLDLESMSFLIAEATNTKAITITVHPDVYAKLTGDTTNPAAAELTGEELAQWQQLLVDAAEKQITFATT